jgi:hypothetical protein
MKRQGDLREKFPPIVVTSDGHLVDGATRVKAANLNEYPTIQAVVLDATFEGATDGTRSRLWALGAGYNARNGKGIDRKEIQRAVDQLSANPIFDATRIAALIGVTDNTLRGFMAERRARDRAEAMKVDLNGKVPAATVKTIGRSAESLNNGPYKALLELVRDAGIGGNELSSLISMKEQKSDQGALDVIEEERKARKEQSRSTRPVGEHVLPRLVAYGRASAFY